LKASAPNFISEIFFLCIGMGHCGYFKTINSYTDASRHVEESGRHIDLVEQERTWVGVSDSPSSRLRDIQ